MEKIADITGGVIPEWSYDMHKSILAAAGCKCEVRFNLGFFRDDVQYVIKITFPDGSGMTHCAEVENEEISVAGKALKRYYVKAEFMITGQNRGVAYAALYRDGVVAAGIVFSTAGPMEAGKWSGNDVAPLDPYSLSEATERLRDALIFPLPFL